MALYARNQAESKPNRTGLNNLRMGNAWPEFDEEKATEYSRKNQAAFDARAGQFYADLVAEENPKEP